VLEAILDDVVAQPELERLVELGRLRQRLRDRSRCAVELADEQLLLELPGAGEDAAATVDEGAAPVEDELVLATDQVAEGERGAAGACAIDQHLLPLIALAARIRRARWVDDQLSARLDLERLGGSRNPDVLADRQPHELARDLDRGRLRARLEIAGLVEHRVVRQPALAIDRAHLAVREHGERVVDRPRPGGVEARCGEVRGRLVAAATGLGEADQGDDSRDARGELPDGPLIRRREMPLQEEILGRIAGKAELGKDDEVGALAAGALDPVGDLRRVAGEVADGRVHLGKRQTHAHMIATRAPVAPRRARPR
jgi:hypothetical protein